MRVAICRSDAATGCGPGAAGASVQVGVIVVAGAGRAEGAAEALTAGPPGGPAQRRAADRIGGVTVEAPAVRRAAQRVVAAGMPGHPDLRRGHVGPRPAPGQGAAPRVALGGQGRGAHGRHATHGGWRDHDNGEQVAPCVPASRLRYESFPIPPREGRGEFDVHHRCVSTPPPSATGPDLRHNWPAGQGRCVTWCDAVFGPDADSRSRKLRGPARGAAAGSDTTTMTTGPVRTTAVPRHDIGGAAIGRSRRRQWRSARSTGRSCRSAAERAGRPSAPRFRRACAEPG